MLNCSGYLPPSSSVQHLALQLASLRLDLAIAVLEVTKERARTSVHAFKRSWSLMHFKQNPISNTQIGINHLSVSKRSVPISNSYAICRLIHWICLQSSATFNLPNCSIPKHGQPPALSPTGISGPRGTYRRPIRGAESELESQEPVQPPAGTVQVFAAFAASLYRGGESCQWGGALETTSCWKILSVPGLKKAAWAKDLILSRA